jgi:TonB family protein
MPMRFPIALAFLALAACATTPREAPPSIETLLALPVDSSRTYEESQVDQKPRLVNTAVVRRALEQSYPAHLRDAGISGEVMVRLVIDEQGVPRGAHVVEGRGHHDFNAAAVAVLNVARYAPAVHQGHRVRLSMAIPVTFMPQR